MEESSTLDQVPEFMDHLDRSTILPPNSDFGDSPNLLPKREKRGILDLTASHLLLELE